MVLYEEERYNLDRTVADQWQMSDAGNLHYTTLTQTYFNIWHTVVTHSKRLRLKLKSMKKLNINIIL